MSFTCFDKFKGVLDSIPDEADRKTMALAIIEYGLTGEDPAFGYPLSAIFEGVREDIDNSRDARGKNKGGPPEGQPQQAQAGPLPRPRDPGRDGMRGFRRSKKRGFPKPRTPVSSFRNPRFRNWKPRPVQASTSQYRPFGPPTPFGVPAAVPQGAGRRLGPGVHHDARAVPARAGARRGPLRRRPGTGHDRVQAGRVAGRGRAEGHHPLAEPDAQHAVLA